MNKHDPVRIAEEGMARLLGTVSKLIVTVASIPLARNSAIRSSSAESLDDEPKHSPTTFIPAVLRRVESRRASHA